MDASQLWVPSPVKARLLVLMRNFHSVRFEDAKRENLYENRTAFKTAMKDLHLHGLVNWRSIIFVGNEYVCTDKGNEIGNALYECSK